MLLKKQFSGRLFKHKIAGCGLQPPVFCSGKGEHAIVKSWHNTFSPLSPLKFINSTSAPHSKVFSVVWWTSVSFGGLNVLGGGGLKVKVNLLFSRFYANTANYFCLSTLVLKKDTDTQIFLRKVKTDPCQWRITTRCTRHIVPKKSFLISLSCSKNK